MFKIEDFWMGAPKKWFNEGFDSLFKVDAGYQIPAPSAEAQERLDQMRGTTVVDQHQDEEKGLIEQEGFGDAMDSVFGSSLFGKREEKEEHEQEFDFDTPLAPPKNTSPLQVVSHGAQATNIVVCEPRSFEDSLEIVNHLKDRKSVIVNLQFLDNDLSQRVIDFVSGSTLALDGTQERVGHGVFIFASMNCTVETESEGVRAYKDLFAKTFA